MTSRSYNRGSYNAGTTVLDKHGNKHSNEVKYTYGTC